MTQLGATNYPNLDGSSVTCKKECAYDLHESSAPRFPYIISNEADRVYRLRQKYLTQSYLIRKFNRCRLVSTTVIVRSAYRRGSTKSLLASAGCIQYFYHHLCGSSVHPAFFNTCSSGQSSPQSAFGSLSFSSSNSSSTQSPPSSHGSFADLSTSPTPFIRPQPRIQVASLLSDPRTRSYHLEIVQHPHRTAEFGTAYLSRVPLTPPVIVQLTVRDPSGNSVIPESELPFLVAHLSLFSGDGQTALDMGSFIGMGVMQNPPILYGHLVSTVEQLEDLQGNMGLFFLFPDVSIRSRGHYQLGVTLTRITTPDHSGLAEHGTVLASTRTRPFEAVSLHEYTAAPTTRLTQSFIRQGARIFANMPYPSGAR